MLRVGKSQDVEGRLSVDVLPDIDRIVGTVDDEFVSLSFGGFEFRVCPFVSKLHVLQGSDGDSHFLRVIAFLVLFASVLSLVSERVAMSSPLNFILTPSLIVIHQEYFLDFCLLNFDLLGEDG